MDQPIENTSEENVSGRRSLLRNLGVASLGILAVDTLTSSQAAEAASTISTLNDAIADIVTLNAKVDAIEDATLDLFLDLSTTAAFVDKVVLVKGNTVIGTNGGYYRGTSGSVVTDGKTQINSSTPNVYWKAFDIGACVPLIRPSVKTDSTYGNVIVGNNPIGGAGNDWPLVGSLKDAITVSRSLTGEQANFHGFADKTVMNGMLNGGGYSGFDSTVTLRGTVHQNHVHSYQDRNIFSVAAPGIVDLTCGFYSAPIINNSGTITERRGACVLDITKSGGAVVTNNVGYYAEDMAGGTTNVSFLSKQSTDFAYYAPNGAKLYQKGKAGFGNDPISFPYIVSFTGAGVAAPLGFVDTDASYGTTLGTFGDDFVTLSSNAGIRVRLKKSANAYALTPGGDNTQPLGDAINRWQVVYAGTGTINTSDERLKNSISNIPDSVLRAVDKIDIVQYKFNDAADIKGDGARWHFGAIAQRVKEAFESEGLNCFDYGLLCYNSWGDEFEKIQTNKEEMIEIEVSERVPVMIDCEQEVQIVRMKDGVKHVSIESRLVNVESGEFETIRKTKSVPAEPKFKTVQTQWGGDRYGIRYEELLALKCASSDRKIADLYEKLSGKF